MTNSKPKTGSGLLPKSLAVWFTGAVVLIGLVCWPSVFLIGSGGPTNLLSFEFIGILGFISSFLALAPLIAVWCSVLGGWKPYLIGGVALLINGVILASLNSDRPSWLLVVLLPLGIATPTCMTMEFIKYIFGKFSKIMSDGQAYEEGLQFKLSHLFITTTVIALLFGIWQAVREFFGGFDLRNGLLKELSCITVVFATNTLFSVWAILGKSMFWRLTLVVPMAVGVIALGSTLIDSDSQFPIWAIVSCVCFVATAVLLLLLRFEGYRFVRKSVG